MTACMMYVCFIHEKKVNRYGKQFVKNLFCTLTFLIPLIMAILYMPVAPHQSSFEVAWVNQCFGREVSAEAQLCMVDDRILHQQYGNWSNAARTTIQVFCWIEISYMSLFLTNVLDIIFYILIYSHLKKYVQ